MFKAFLKGWRDDPVAQGTHTALAEVPPKFRSQHMGLLTITYDSNSRDTSDLCGHLHLCMCMHVHVHTRAHTHTLSHAHTHSLTHTQTETFDFVNFVVQTASAPDTEST